jgi:hypothetical protein
MAEYTKLSLKEDVDDQGPHTDPGDAEPVNGWPSD